MWYNGSNRVQYRLQAWRPWGDETMKMQRVMFGLGLLGVLMVGLIAGADLWAAPGQSPERQTVPTRTPTSAPATPSPTEPPSSPSTSSPPKDQPMSTPTATPETTPAGPPELLPDSGGRSDRVLLGAMMIIVSLLVLALVRRRVWY